MRTIALSVGLLCCLFVLGCASGRRPEPVLSYMPGDGAMSCEELHVEMANVRQEMILKQTKIQEKDIRNWELFGAGLFLGYPWGEIDNFKAEEIERKALYDRYKHLFVIAAQKGCALGNNKIAVKKPGGREPTWNDILNDELPPRLDPLAIMTR